MWSRYMGYTSKFLKYFYRMYNVVLKIINIKFNLNRFYTFKFRNSVYETYTSRFLNIYKLLSILNEEV